MGKSADHQVVTNGAERRWETVTVLGGVSGGGVNLWFCSPMRMNALQGKTTATNPPTASTNLVAILASVTKAGNLLLDPPMAQSTQCAKG